MFTSLHSSSTARGLVITIIQSLPIRNCLLYICSAELISNTLKSKTYILLPRNTCFHGSLTCLLTKHSIIDEFDAGSNQ